MSLPTSAPYTAIPVPELLKGGKARELNNLMIKNHHALVFLGEQEILINRTPSTYAEAFDLYIKKLYVLYHDCAMEFINNFLECCGDTCCKYHIKFVKKARAVDNHAENLKSENYIFNNLRRYYFKYDTDFGRYGNWKEFWKDASSDKWKTIVERLSKDSDYLYNILYNIATGNVSEDYITKIQERFKEEQVYEDSFNYRALNQFSESVKFCYCDELLHYDKKKCENLFERFCKQDQIEPSDDDINYYKENGKMTPAEMKSTLIEKVIRHLNNEDCVHSSQDMYTLILQEVYQIITSPLSYGLII